MGALTSLLRMHGAMWTCLLKWRVFVGVRQGRQLDLGLRIARRSADQAETIRTIVFVVYVIELWWDHACRACQREKLRLAELETASTGGGALLRAARARWRAEADLSD